MNSRAAIGILLIGAGALIFFFTPSNVTWGNHHYIRHFVQYGLMGVGAIFILVGARR